MESQSEMLLKQTVEMEGKMDKIESMKKEVNKLWERIKKVEQKTNELKNDWKYKSEKLECKLLDKVGM